MGADRASLAAAEAVVAGDRHNGSSELLVDSRCPRPYRGLNLHEVHHKWRHASPLNVKATARWDKPCELSLELALPADAGASMRLVNGCPSVDILRLYVRVPIVPKVSFLQDFARAIAGFSQDDQNGQAVLHDCDEQPVLRITWVQSLRPMLILSGEYVGAFCNAGGTDPDSYPSRALNSVQYTGLPVNLPDVDALARDIRSWLRDLAVPSLPG